MAWLQEWPRRQWSARVKPSVAPTLIGGEKVGGSFRGAANMEHPADWPVGPPESGRRTAAAASQSPRHDPPSFSPARPGQLRSAPSGRARKSSLQMVVSGILERLDDKKQITLASRFTGRHWTLSSWRCSSSCWPPAATQFVQAGHRKRQVSCSASIHLGLSGRVCLLCRWPSTFA